MAFAWISAWLSRPPLPTVRSLREEGFIAIDLETTGLDPCRDAIVSFAAIPFVGGEPRPGHVTLVDPGRPIPGASTAIHGITDAMVAGAVSTERLITQLDTLFGDRVLTGHGVNFDLAILDRERRVRGLPRLRNLPLDTQLLAAALHRRWPDFSLESVAERTGVPIRGRHTAEGDALMAGRILLALLPALEARGFRTAGELAAFQRRGRPRR